MKQFAKLFEFEDLGQVLVMLDRGDDGTGGAPLLQARRAWRLFSGVQQLPRR